MSSALRSGSASLLAGPSGGAGAGAGTRADPPPTSGSASEASAEFALDEDWLQCRGGLPPALVGAVPGPASRALAQRLARVECRDTTALEPTPPIFWERALGANIWDADGNRFVDLGGAFGVACAGHSHPRVVAAIAEQARTLLHGMGDVQPAAVKVALLEALAARFPGGEEALSVLTSSGSDAVETALKTVMMATGKAGVVAFEGGYHGLSLGALDATHRPDFRAPFAARLANATAFARFGDAADVERSARELERSGVPVGAVLVEPIQGRGGERVPPEGFLRELRSLCDARGWLLVADEIYTGMGRTGRWFACEHEGVVPDLLCVGKGLASGMPLSACIGRRSVMDRWPASRGEALHTQTFLGHPAGCAAALASLRVIEEEKLVEASARSGGHALERMRERLAPLPTVEEIRGRGLMLGIACREARVSHAACTAMLERGYVLLPSGEEGRVLSLTPPLTIAPERLDDAIEALRECLS